MLSEPPASDPGAPPSGGSASGEPPVPWVEIDVQGRVSWCNPRFSALLGREDPATVQGEAFSQMLTPASQVYFDLGVLPSLQLGQDLREVHLLMRQPGGPDLPVLCYGVARPGPLFSLAIVPIPERRRLESDLISVRNAVEQVPGAVFQLRQDGRGRLHCVYLSGDALALLGVARPQVHRALWKLMSRSVRRGFAQTLAKAAENFSLFRFDIPLRDGAVGSPRWLHVQARAQLHADGSERLWFGHIMDVSQLKRTEAALQASETRYRSLAEASPIGIFQADSAGGCRFANAGWHALFGGGKAQGAGWLDCIEEPGRSQVVAALRAADARGTRFEIDFEVRTASGALRQVRLHAQPLAGSQGHPDGVVGTVEDITERRAMERALAENHELLRVTLESIGEAVITTDTEGRVRWINPVAERMSGCRIDSARGRPLDEVLCILDASTHLPTDNVALRCIRGGRSEPDAEDCLLMSSSGGDIRFLNIELSVAPIRNAAGETLGAVVVFHDVTRQREEARNVELKATQDELTGLYNRGKFRSCLEDLLRQPQAPGTGHVLLFIDLDQFKLINDACGHAAGDVALCSAVDQFKAALREFERESGSTLARIGGDEFAILLHDCDRELAERIGRRICSGMEDFRFVFKGRPFRLGASIGLVVIDERWQEVTDLLQAADTACYAAKEAGRNRVQAWGDDDRLQLRRIGEMRWAARLAEAIDGDRLELFAQRIEPTLGRSEALHCELLLRVTEADGSMVPPGDFIAAAERFHMATRIDRWVVRRALQILASQRARGAAIASVSINVSGQSIGDPAFRADLAAQLRAARGQVDLGTLCFEITETVLASNFTDAEAFVREVRALGARIALDDFGVGEASFGQIRKLPLDCIDYLKIDGVFIRDGFANPIDGVAVRFFQELARTIGARTVAEWVQDERVRTELGRLGVDFVQGFLIHRPEPLVDLLARWVESPVTVQTAD